MTRKEVCIAAIALALMAFTAQAGEIVSETFDTDGPIDDYTGAGEVFFSYVRTGSTVPVAEASGGEFEMELTLATDTNLYTHISLGGIQTLASVRLDYRGVQHSSTTTPWAMYVGSFSTATDFSPGWNVHQGARNWSKVRINGSNPYYVSAEDGINTKHNSPTNMVIGEVHTWSYYANETGSTKQFTGPDGATHSLDTACWSFFVGTELVADSVVKGTTGDNGSLQGIVFNVGRNWYGAKSKSTVDNILVRNDLDLYVGGPIGTVVIVE